jgi:DNA-binding winged helix-turn-helix (wHTH) protein
MQVTFGPFVVDFQTRQLLRDSQSLHLTPKAYHLLALLVESRPRAISKSELQQSLWPSTFVGEANLTVLVAELRAALGDDARRPTYVRTVFGFGYAFAADITDAPVTTAAPTASGVWWLHSDIRHIKLHDGDNVVGREMPVDVWLDTPSVSRQHARIVIDGRHSFLEDLGSRNGTWLNGSRVTGRHEMADGDELRFGPIVFRLRWATTSGPTESMTPE